MSGYPPGYVPISYPRWKYSPTQPPVIVADPTSEAALGDGWYDTPNFPAEPDLGAADYDPQPIS